MKKFLVLAVMLSVLLFGMGTSYAVLGVADDVPGTDVVIPFICEKGGTLNTLWAVADVDALPESADILVFTIRSVLVYDDVEVWTPLDVVVNDCHSLIAGMSATQKAALEVTFAGKTYYAGYLVYYNDLQNNDVFAPWVYLVDLPKGYASGFNGYAAEGFVDLIGLEESNVPITASALFPRYFILNANSATWWIILKGANGIHDMVGFICNEEERCISLSIPIPNELNLINVEPYVPAILHTGYPKAGFGIFALVPGGAFAGFTTLGWSYQRAAGATVAGTWDVIHPIHRLY